MSEIYKFLKYIALLELITTINNRIYLKCSILWEKGWNHWNKIQTNFNLHQENFENLIATIGQALSGYLEIYQHRCSYNLFSPLSFMIYTQ